MNELKKSTATTKKCHFDLVSGSFGSLFCWPRKKKAGPIFGSPATANIPLQNSSWLYSIIR